MVSSEDGTDGRHFSIYWPQPLGCAHCGKHRVVDVDPLGADIQDLSGLEAAIRAGDCMKYPR
jgi:hypothetical protein